MSHITLPHNVTVDGNGNVTEYIDANGTPVAHYEYAPFGGITASSGDKRNDFTHRFSTKPYDVDTGLIRYQLRDYSPTLGRWVSRDPIEERGGLNLYGWCLNNGIGMVDFHGLRTPPLNDFFNGEKAKYNVTRTLVVDVKCLKGTSGNVGISENDQTANCAGGAISVTINMRVGVPAQIRPPLPRDPIGTFISGGGYGEIPDQFVPLKDWVTPADFWGDPTQVGVDRRGPGNMFQYPIYEYKKANFNVGRFIDIKTAYSDSWEVAAPHLTEMFRKWRTLSNSVLVGEVNALFDVGCGDQVSIQIGCKGEPKLAWDQVLQIF